MTSGDSRQDDDLSAGTLESLAKLQPGDAVEIWLEHAYIVTTVFQCREAIDGRVTEWCWAFLDDGSLVEASPDGCFRYREHRVLKQGSSEYEELVAQDGALVRFEERVRAGTSGRRPVRVTVDSAEYYLASTGTVEVRRSGAEPEILPWQSFSSDPGKNVYFGMVMAEDEEKVVLGLWTNHVCLFFGAPIKAAQISGVYRRNGR